MPKTILSTDKLSKTFSSSGLQQHVLRNLDIEIYEGDFTVIMGPSGAGKSTLLYALSGMDQPTLGQVFFDGQNISDMTTDQLAVFRRQNCGFVFQQIYLMDNMNVMDNILVSGLLTKRRKKTLVKDARELLTQVGLDEAQWRKFPSQLSGGEAQRAGIIRAVINRPKMLFADEPTGSLNSASGTMVLDMLTHLNRQGQSIVMITHDIACARRGSRVLYLRDGAICGECRLGDYKSGSSERHDRLNGFLAEMGW